MDHRTQLNPATAHRGQRDGHVKGYAVTTRQDGASVGADLIGDISSAAEGAIAPHDNEVDLVALHEMSGGIVGDNLVGYVLVG